MRRFVAFAVLLCLVSFAGSAQELTIRHLLGPDIGKTGDPNRPAARGGGVPVRAPDGSLFLASYDHIRKMMPNGTMYVHTGLPGTWANVDGSLAQARFWGANLLALDTLGNLYVGEQNNGDIRKITPQGVVSRVTFMSSPEAMATDNANNLYVSTGHLFYKIAPNGTKTVFVGSSTAGSADGTGTFARFRNPYGIVFDGVGAFYVGDTYNATIRKVTLAGVVTTIAGSPGVTGTADGTGSAARFTYPSSMTFDGSNLYVIDNNEIRKVTPSGVVTTIAGAANFNGWADGIGANARFTAPEAIIWDGGTGLIVADFYHYTLRRISLADNSVTTFAGQGPEYGTVDGQGTAARISPWCFAAGSDGYIYFPDGTTIRRFDAAGNVSTFAGVAGDARIINGPLSAARFKYPTGLAFDPSGNLYVCENSDYVVRKIATDGTVSTFAGVVGLQGTLDGPRGSSYLYSPFGITSDSHGNLFVTDYNAVRKITPDGTLSTFAGNVTQSGWVYATGTAARFSYPTQIGCDPSDNLYLMDGNAWLKKITPDAVVTAASQTQIDGQFAFDPAGNLWFPSAQDQLIRRAPDATETSVQNFLLPAGEGTGSNSHLDVHPRVIISRDGHFYFGNPNYNTIAYGTPAIADNGVIDAATGPVNTPRQLSVNGTAASSVSWVFLFRPSGSAAQIASPDSFATSFTPDVEGNYRIRCITASGSGQRITDIDFLATCAAPPAPVITQTAGTNPNCYSTNATLTGPPGYSSYLWSTGATTQSITVATFGTATYTLTVYSAWNCPSPTSAPYTLNVVTAVNSVNAVLSGSANLCPGTTGGTITATDNGGTASNTHSWWFATVHNAAGTQITGQSGTSYVLNAADFPGPGTYYVTCHSRASCNSTDARSNEITVVINAAPQATIAAGGATTFCAGGSVTLTANSGASYLWSNGATTQSIAAASTGDYSVQVTDANGCSATSAVTHITVNTPPATPVVTPGGATTFCAGGSVTLTAPSGYAYLWSNNATTQSITVTASGDYSVRVTDANGCFATSAATSVTVNAAPTATITPSGATTFCAGGSVTLTASSGSSYLWSDGATTQSVVATATGTYTVTLTNANGCSTTSDALTVTVNPLPDATIAVSGSTVLCDGASVTLTAAAGYTYSWSNGATTRSIAVSQAGSYSVTVTGAGCSATSAPVDVTNDPTTVTISGGPSMLCPGDMVHLTSSVANGTATSFQWYGFGGQAISGATSSTLDIAPATTGYYFLRIGDGNSCTVQSNTFIFTVDQPAATITAGGATTFCDGGSVTLTANSGASYLWSNGATTQSINVTTTGDYTVTVTTANGCSATSAATHVTVNAVPAKPVITPGGATTFCDGGSVTLTAPAGYTYSWSNGATSQSINVTSTGDYSVTVSNGNCTATSDATHVTVNAVPAKPAITAGGATTFCAGDSVTLTAPAGYTYSWSNGATTQSINVTSTGDYSVTVSNGNCTATSDATHVTVNTVPAKPVITAGGATTFCASGSVTLTAPAGYTYSWSNGATSQSINVTSTGDYSVTVSNGNCTATSDATHVTVNTVPAKPVITAGGATTFCAGDSVTLTAPAGYTYSWSNGATTQSINVTSTGDYTVTVSNGNCTATSDATHVTVNTVPAKPVITAGGSTTFCADSSVTLTAPAGYTYSWSNGATTQSINVTSTGDYSVTVSNGNCTATSDATHVTVNTVPAKPVITAGGSTTFCADSSVTLTAPGGYTYSWSNGATTQSINVTSTGDYTVTVSNGNCTATSDATHVQVNAVPAKPVINASGATTFCTGGSVTLTAPASTSYLWSNGLTTQSINLTTTGDYTVRVANAFCQSVSSDTVHVQVNTNPPVPVITPSGSTAICPGSSVTLSAPAGYTYLWSNGLTTQSINVSAAGNYTVTISNGNCTATSAPASVTLKTTTSLTQPSNITIARNTNGTLSVAANGTNLHYQWYSGTAGNTGTPLGTAATQGVGPYKLKGTYPFWVRVTGDCGTASSSTVNVTVN